MLTKSQLNDHLRYDAERIVDAYTGSPRLLSGLGLLRCNSRNFERGEKMPPKESEKLPEFYVLFPDGKRMTLGEVEEIKTISDREDLYESQLYIAPTQEYEFTCRWNPKISLSWKRIT